MNQNFTALLYEGIDILCKNDKDTDRIITPRKNETAALLERYIEEIKIFNPAYGLVGTNDTRELIIKHIMDSLAPLGAVSRSLSGGGFISDFKYSIADAGSGAGLPGIPLAIALPNCEFTLIERMRRRAGFLLNVKAVLKLSNINIEDKEAGQVQGIFDLVVFRAFKPLEPKLLKTLKKLCKPDGIIAAYKGKREKISAELQNAESGEQIKSMLIPCNVPFLDEERHLAVIKVKENQRQNI